MNQTYRSKVLLIDDPFLLEVHNLQRKVNQAVKHPHPVLGPGRTENGCKRKRGQYDDRHFAGRGSRVSISGYTQ